MVRNDLRAELLQLIREDGRVRAELESEDSLYEGYHPRMEQVHRNNAARLRGIIAEVGWPGISMVGKDGEEAAWRIAQHSISEPEFMRTVLSLLKAASEINEAPSWQIAYTEDRIRMFEGRPQLYGTSFDWDENLQMSPYPEIEQPSTVDQRRAAVGLPPLKQAIENHRAKLDERPPSDLRKRRDQMHRWAQSVGWREM